MKPIQSSRQGLTLSCLAGSILMGALTGGAANYWIDVNGTTSGSGVANGGSYDWTAANWGDFAGTATPVVWPGGSNQAFMNGAGASTSYTVRLGGTGASNVTLQNFGININSATSGASGNGDVVIGNPGDTGLLTLNAANSFGAQNGGSLTVNNGINLNGFTTNFRGGSVTINGVVSGTGTSNLALNSGAFGLSSGTLTLSGNNSYVGTTTVASNYTLVAQHANALGGTTSGTTVSSGGVVQVAGGVTINAGESISVAGGGANFFGALQAGSSGGTWAGQVTLGDTSVRLGALAAQTLSITGSIVNGAGTGFNVSGQSGTGVVILNPTTSNTYTGTTGIIRGILRLGKTNALPTGTTLDVDSTSSVGDAAVFDLASFSQTVAALQDTASDAAGTIRNSVASTTSTLTVNQAGTTVFQGLIENGSGTVALVKGGAGTLTLTGSNTFSGGVTVGASSGTLIAEVSSTKNSLGSGAASVGTGSTLQVSNINTTTDTTVSNTLTGSGQLILNFAAGTTARNTYMSNVTGFTGTIRLSNAGSTGDKWNASGLGTIAAALTIDSGSQLFAGSGTTTFSNGISVTGTGNSESRGAIRLGGTVGGDISLAGSTTIGGEGGTLSGDITSGASGTQTLTFAGSGTGNATVSGNIGGGTGTIALVQNKSGGTLTLSGTNTFTGNTTLTAGKIVVSNTAALGAAGRTLQFNGSSTTLDLATDTSVNAYVLDLTSGNTATIEVNRATSGAAITHTMGAPTFGNSTLNVTAGANVASGTPTLALNGISLTAGVAGLGTMTLNPTTANIAVNGNITRPGSSANSLTLSGTSSGNTITGAISGALALTMTGTGTWSLSGNNTHTGLTSTSAGTLVLTGNNSIGRVDVNGGTFLVSGGTTSLSSYLTVNTLGSTGTFLQTGGTVQLTSGTNGAYVGNSGSPSSIFNMTGGTFTVAGSEGFRMRAGGTSTTSISGGALLSAAGSNGLHFNKPSGSAIFNLGDGTTFVSGTSGILTVSKVWRDAGTSNTFNFNGGTLKASAGNASFFVDDADITTLVKSAGGIVDNGGFAITIGEQLAEDGGSPGGGMTFKGAGTTTLTNGNSYTGATSVTAGTLNIQHNNALGTTAGATSLTTGTKLQVQGVGLNIPENFTLGTGSTGVTVENVSGTNILSGTITRNGALTFTSLAGHLTVQSGIGNTSNSVNMGGAGDGEISGPISVAFSVNKNDGGTWTLSGNNTYTSATTVNLGGALRITHNNALGATAGGTSVNNLGALQLAGGITVTGESLSLNGPGVANDGGLRNISGNNTWAGNVAVGAASITRVVSDADLLTITGTVGLSAPASNQFVLQGDGNILLSGVISGVSGLTSSVTGAGVRTLGNANTYSGTTTVSGGTLRLLNNASVGSGTLRLNGGRLTSDANPRTITNSVEVPLDSALGSGTAGFDGSILLSGNVVMQGADSSRVLTVDSPVTMAGTVTGSSLRGLIKGGSSTLTLSGSGDWNGNTGVTAGTFQMTGSSSIPSGGNLNASGTGVFRMNTTGVLNASSTSILDSSEIRLEAGTLRTNSITMGGSGTFNWSGGTLETHSNAVLGSGLDASQSGGAAVYTGRTLAVTGNLTTGAGTNLDLGDLYLSGSVLYNQITITGSLSVGAGTTLSALDSPYLLRPSTGGMNLDWGTLVLVDAAGGITNPSNFAFVAPLADGRPFSEFTGTWVSAGDPAQLDPDTWYLEYTANQVLFHYKVSAAIPEPASAGLVLAGGLLLRTLSRRSRAR